MRLMLDESSTGPGNRPATWLRSASGLFAFPMTKIERRVSRLDQIDLLPSGTGREGQRTVAEDVSPGRPFTGCGHGLKTASIN